MRGLCGGGVSYFDCSSGHACWKDAFRGGLRKLPQSTITRGLDVTLFGVIKVRNCGGFVKPAT